MANLLKKHLKWILYFLGIFFVTISVKFFQKENLAYAITFFIISFGTYSFLIIKDFKFLSVVSYVTLIISIFAIMEFATGDASNDTIFATANQEKVSYIIFGVLIPLIVSLCTYLITIGGWKKTISLIFLAMSFAALLLIGTASPSFHNNFVYTRIFIGIIFIYSIYLIFKKEKLPRIGGIIGVVASIVALLFSTVLFSGQVYTIEGGEKEEVLNFIEPKVQEMFQSYNQGDFKNFCKHCSESLRTRFSEEDFGGLRNAYGGYISHEGSDITRTGGSYYINYVVNFQNVNPVHFILQIEQTTPESTIRGFSIHEGQEE